MVGRDFALAVLSRHSVAPRSCRLFFDLPRWAFSIVIVFVTSEKYEIARCLVAFQVDR
jgi:hypothetical protein